MAKERQFKAIVQVAIIEVNTDYTGAEKVWSEERIVVPLERLAALDVVSMVERARLNVVVVAGVTDEVKNG